VLDGGESRPKRKKKGGRGRPVESRQGHCGTWLEKKLIGGAVQDPAELKNYPVNLTFKGHGRWAEKLNKAFQDAVQNQKKTKGDEMKKIKGGLHSTQKVKAVGTKRELTSREGGGGARSIDHGRRIVKAEDVIQTVEKGSGVLATEKRLKGKGGRRGAPRKKRGEGGNRVVSGQGV